MGVSFVGRETLNMMQASPGHGHTSASALGCRRRRSTPGHLHRRTPPPRSPAALVTPSPRERERGGGVSPSRTSQFLSFLGRHARAGTPDHPERDWIQTDRTTPSSRVSTTDQSEDGPTRADSSVGSSWASLVDRSALGEIPMRGARRRFLSESLPRRVMCGMVNYPSRCVASRHVGGCSCVFDIVGLTRMVSPL